MDRRGSGGYRGGRMRGDRRGGGRGGLRRHRGANGEGSSQFKTPKSFEISDDQTTFRFPRWQEIDTNPPLLHNFTSSIKCIGGYSEDEDKDFCNDKSYLSFLNMEYFPDSKISKEKKIDFNLTTGEEEAKQYSAGPLEGFHNFLSWILSNEEKYMEKPTGNGAKFVFLKNVLSGIMLSFNDIQARSFYAICSDGIIYLLNIRKGEIKRPNSDRIAIWSHKFEQLMTISCHTEGKVICNWDYRTVLSSQLGDHKLIYSCVTDCVNPDKYDEAMEDCSAIVYLRCLRDNPQNRLTHVMERYKFFKFCVDLTLTGAPEIIIGFRDDDGKVESLKLYEKDDLVQEGKGHWDLFTAFTFLDNLLSFVKQRAESKPGTLFKFTRPERSSLFTASEEEMIPDFLPDWFQLAENFRPTAE